MPDNPARAEVWATCHKCCHTFVVYAPLPAPMDVVAKAMARAKCDACGSSKPLHLAREAEIVAALDKASKK
jgi:hypothetical protein